MKFVRPLVNVRKYVARARVPVFAIKNDATFHSSELKLEERR